MISQRELRSLNFKTLENMESFLDDMIKHLNTDTQDKIVKFYGLDQHKLGRNAVKEMSDDMTFLRFFRKEVRLLADGKIKKIVTHFEILREVAMLKPG